MNISEASSIGELLKEFRRRAGMTQKYLAQRVEVSPDTIGTWERDEALSKTKGLVWQLIEAWS